MLIYQFFLQNIINVLLKYYLNSFNKWPKDDVASKFISDLTIGTEDSAAIKIEQMLNF